MSVMPTPDPATLAAGQAIGGNAASPLITYTRRSDLVSTDWVGVSETVLMGVIVTAGKIKSISVVPGSVPIADGLTTMAIHLYRGGSTVATLWSGTLAAWTGFTLTSLATPGTVTQMNDLVFLSFSKGAPNVIPGLTFIVEQNIGL